MKEVYKNGNKVKLYTYEDWLKGEIDGLPFRAYGGNVIHNLKSPSDINKIVNVFKDDFKKIIDARQSTYDYFLKFNQDTKKLVFITKYLDESVREEFINNEIQECELNIDKCPIQERRLGEKDIYSIISKNYLDKDKFQDFGFYTLNGNHSYRCIIEYKTWLKQFIGANEKQKSRLIQGFYKSLSDKQKQVLKLKGFEKLQDFIESKNKVSYSTYKWTGYETDADELHQVLTKKQLINSDLQTFKGIFGLGEFIGPCRWKDSNASELLYFIIQLNECGLSCTTTKEEGKQTDYGKLKTLFVQDDDTPFDNDFKSLKNKLDTNLSENRKNLIDNILEESK